MRADPHQLAFRSTAAEMAVDSPSMSRSPRVELPASGDSTPDPAQAAADAIQSVDFALASAQTALAPDDAGNAATTPSLSTIDNPVRAAQDLTELDATLAAAAAITEGDDQLASGPQASLVQQTASESQHPVDPGISQHQTLRPPPATSHDSAAGPLSTGDIQPHRSAPTTSAPRVETPTSAFPGSAADPRTPRAWAKAITDSCPVRMVLRILGTINEPWHRVSPTTRTALSAFAVCNMLTGLAAVGMAWSRHGEQQRLELAGLTRTEHPLNADAAAGREPGFDVSITTGSSAEPGESTDQPAAGSAEAVSNNVDVMHDEAIEGH